MKKKHSSVSISLHSEKDVKRHLGPAEQDAHKLFKALIHSQGLHYEVMAEVLRQLSVGANIDEAIGAALYVWDL